MNEAASQRAPVSRLRVADARERFGKGRNPLAQNRRLQRRSLPDHRTDDRRAVPLLDPIQPGNSVDVDHVGGPCEPEVEGGNEALAAGEDGGVGPVLGEQRERFLEGLGTMVGEGRRLHPASSSGSVTQNSFRYVSSISHTSSTPAGNQQKSPAFSTYSSPPDGVQRM